MRVAQFLGLVASTSAVFAQGVVPPVTLRAKQRTPGFMQPPVPGTGLEQVHMVALPGDPAGTWTCSLTVENLPAGNGGVGGTDLLTGKYDALTDTFTPDNPNLAANLNTSGTEFGLVVHSSGLWAVLDRLPGSPILCNRANLTAPWTPLGPLQGLPSQSYYDPSLATYNGQLVLVHVWGNDIGMSVINTAGISVGPATLIARANRSGATANSPTPIVDSNGELIGISHHDVINATGDNDHFISMDLDPNTASVMFIDTTTWINNGGFCGGNFYDAEAITPYQIFDVQSAWWTGGRSGINANMEISAYIPPSNTPGSISFFFASRRFLTTAISLPGIGGQLGIDPSFLIYFDIGVHTAATGQAATTLPIPNDPSLHNLVLPAQGVTFNAITNALNFMNTASLTVQ